MKPNKQAFTLIELLVVVLIIGILAAVALPQYQKAVLRSRFTNTKNMAHALATAEEAYYLANGKYTSDFEVLDIDISGTDRENPADGLPNRYFDWGYCDINTSSGYISCYLTENGSSIIGYHHYLEHATANPGGLTWCVATTSDLNALANKVCKTETNREQPTNPSSSFSYRTWAY